MIGRLSIGWLVLVTLTTAFDEDSINRIQFGVLFERLPDFSAVNAEWMHSFIIPIPKTVKPDPFITRTGAIQETDWQKCMSRIIIHLLKVEETPSRNDSFNMGREINSSCEYHAQEIIHLFESYRDFHRTVKSTQDKIDSLLPPQLDLVKLTKIKREGPLLPFIGEITSSLFGLVTTSQINKVI